ncbi:MAG: 50S ribosomal protein L10 [Puniceicoccales bacterium]|jgi:large subunit ribosomal protein L10|nr:50S ribosomal protein L10 [Puniceicoccales bacterium]
MRAEKQLLIDEVAAHLAKSKYLLLADFARVTVADAAVIRAQLREHGAEYHVVKNSIFNIAAKQANLPDLSGHLTGHTALVTGGNNPPGVAKILVKFFEGNGRLEVKTAVLDSKVLDKAEVEALSKLPSLEGIRAQLLSLLTTPASQFVRLLVAKKEKDEAAAGGAPAATPAPEAAPAA